MPAGFNHVVRPALMKQYQVKIVSSGITFTVNEGESILTAALHQGVMLPYSCKNGTCGSCTGRLESGDVHYPFHPPLALSQDEIKGGSALLCQAVPTGDLLIHAHEIEAVRDIQVRRMPARVIEKTVLTPDVMLLRIKLPAAQRLQFLAGQYLEVILPEGKRRAFSIASPPQLEDEIELHIRHIEGGDFTGWVFNDLQERDILRIEGPLGTFFIRNDITDRPLILMGGGTGFAPLKSMIEDLLLHRDRRPLHLFWGVRDSTELYMLETVQEWVKQNDHTQFSIALSSDQADGPDTGFKGLVHTAVLQQYPDLSGFDIYMSGPPAMIANAGAAFKENGAKPKRIFFDSFEFGLDVPVKVLAKQH